MNFDTYVEVVSKRIVAAGTAGDKVEAIRLLRLLSDVAAEKAAKLEAEVAKEAKARGAG